LLGKQALYSWDTTA